MLLRTIPYSSLFHCVQELEAARRTLKQSQKQLQQQAVQLDQLEQQHVYDRQRLAATAKQLKLQRLVNTTGEGLAVALQKLLHPASTRRTAEAGQKSQEQLMLSLLQLLASATTRSVQW